MEEPGGAPAKRNATVLDVATVVVVTVLRRAASATAAPIAIDPIIKPATIMAVRPPSRRGAGDAFATGIEPDMGGGGIENGEAPIGDRVPASGRSFPAAGSSAILTVVGMSSFAESNSDADAGTDGTVSLDGMIEGSNAVSMVGEFGEAGPAGGSGVRIAAGSRR
jgi:hypothetical protein